MVWKAWKVLWKALLTYTPTEWLPTHNSVQRDVACSKLESGGDLPRQE